MSTEDIARHRAAYENVADAIVCFGGHPTTTGVHGWMHNDESPCDGPDEATIAATVADHLRDGNGLAALNIAYGYGAIVNGFDANPNHVTTTGVELIRAAQDIIRSENAAQGTGG